MTPHYAPRDLLLVEDNPGDAEYVQDLLPDTLQHVTCLKEAFKVLRSRAFDAVLLDLHLPDGSGVECVQGIREVASELPIVILTGMEDEDLALACITAGAQDYLPKFGLKSPGLRRSVSYAMARARESALARRADALQQHLAAIVGASQDAIVSCDRVGLVRSWNPGAEQILGYTSAEALHRPFTEVLKAPDENQRAEQEARLKEVLENGKPVGPLNVERVRKNGSSVSLSVLLSPVRDLHGEIGSVSAVCRDITELMQRDQELRRKNLELLERDRLMRALTVKLNAVREEERTRLSRSVHDDLGQLLTGLKMDLHYIGRRLPPEGPLNTRIGEAYELIDQIIGTVQTIAIELRPTTLDALGLPAAIRDEARRFSRRFGAPVTTHVDVAETPGPLTSTALFRILQELLTNIARHAQAGEIKVTLADEEDGWLLRVEDDGVGIEPGIEYHPNSLGLLGIRERAAALGGAVKLSQTTSGGTLAEVRIPWSEGENNAEHPDR